jgi:hypothetical protein
MIKIRYSSLPEGLHAQARRESGHTILYLRPGLSAEQRREALRRVRQSARMGHGPKLPAAGLAIALAIDRVTGTVRAVAAAVRLHPFGTGMLAALVAGAVISYSLFVTVSVRLIYPQVRGIPPAPPPSTAPARNPGQASPGGGPGGTSPGRAGGSPPAVVAVQPSPGGLQPSPGPYPSSPAPSPPPTPLPSPFPSSPAAATSPAVTGKPVLKVCVKVGPLGACIRL